MAMLAWIGSYVTLKVAGGQALLALVSAFLVLLGLFILKTRRRSLHPIAKNPKGRARGNRIALLVATGGLLFFVAGWLSWVPRPAKAAVMTWHSWEWSSPAEVSIDDGLNFDPEQPSLPKSSSGRRSGINWLWGQSGPGPLPERIDLEMSNDLAAFLKCSDGPEAFWLADQRAYLVHFSLGRYGDRRWQPVTSERIKFRAEEDRWNWVETEPSPAAKANAIGYELTAESSGGAPLPVLQGVMGLKLSEFYQNQSGILFGGTDSTPRQIVYSGLSRPKIWRDLRGQNQLEFGSPSPAYLEKADGDLGDIISQMVDEKFDRSLSRAQQLEQLAEWIRTEFKYSLQTSNDQGLDPLVNFLTEERRGHCELFATATALFLRELGVASRVSYGHAHGQFLPVSNLFAFRDRDAHAWTEVYLQDYGWTVFDLTPEGGELTAARSEVVATDAFSADYEEMYADPEEDAVEAWGPKLSDGLLLGGGAAVILLVAGWQSMSGRRRRGSQSAEVFEPTYLARLRQLALARGVAKPSSFPVKELLFLIKDKGGIWSGTSQLIEYHYACIYEGQQRNEDTERELTQQIPLK